MHKTLHLFRTTLFLFAMQAGSWVHAQNYPIQTNVVLAPPYTLSLPAYSTEAERFGVQLLNKDFATPVVDLYLQLKIEGPGVTLETKATYRPSAPITITAGIPALLSGVDLSELFSPSNLNFFGLNQSDFVAGGSLLPEGLYRFSMRAMDYNQNIQVSNWGTAATAIFKHLPPIINLPQDKSYVGLQNPQYLQIQFTPRHTISPSLIGKIRYKIRLIEVLPASRNPNEAMQSSSIPFFENITDQTSFIYGPGEPSLVDGRTYALQVQAIDGDGNDIFENRGFSQVVSFVYGSPCPIPQNLTAGPGDGTGISLNWDPNDRYRSYLVYYRVPGQENQKTELTFINSFNINQLQPNTQYQISVSGVCAENESDKTPPVYVKTAALPTEYETWSNNCGKPLPTIDLSNKNPLPLLQAGDVVLAGDFEVKITAASGGNGIFSGSGLVTLPFTGKIPLPCSFENITLNSDKRLIFGKISLLQQPLEISNRTVKNVAKAWRSFFGTNWNRLSNYNYPGKIIKITTDDQGDIIIEGSNGTQKLSKGRNLRIEDSDGKTWYVSSGGKLSPAEGPKTNAIVKNLETGEGTPSELPPGMAKLFFSADTKDGFDALEVSTLTAGVTYDRMECADTSYTPGWKLLRAGENSKINATFVQGKKLPCPIDSIKFARSDGTLLPFTRSGNEFTLLVTGRMNLYADAIWAFANYNIGPKYPAERWILGKLNLINVDVKPLNVVLIPVNGIGKSTDAKALQTDLDKLFQTFAVGSSVRLDATYIQTDYDAANEKLAVSKTLMNIGYKYQLARFIEGYKATHQQVQNNPANDTAYLFLVNQSTDNTSGYMGINEQFGFIFLNGQDQPSAHTIAHELGHGSLNLEHTFGDNLSQSAHSQNLMDYAPPFSLSNYGQWMAVHDGEQKMRFLQKISDGKQRDATGVVLSEDPTNIGISPDGKVIKSIELSDKSSFCIPGIDKSDNYIISFLKIYRKTEQGNKWVETYSAKYENKEFIGYFSKENIEFPGEIQYNSSKGLKVAIYKNYSKCNYLRAIILWDWSNYSNYETLINDLSKNESSYNWENRITYDADISCYSDFYASNSSDLNKKCQNLNLDSAVNTLIFLTKFPEVTGKSEMLSKVILNSCRSVVEALPFIYKYSAFKTIVKSTFVYNYEEVAALILMSTIHSKDYISFIDSLSINNNLVLRDVIESFHDAALFGMIGDNNYTSFINMLCKMYQGQPALIMDRFNKINKPEDLEILNHIVQFYGNSEETNKDLGGKFSNTWYENSYNKENAQIGIHKYTRTIIPRPAFNISDVLNVNLKDYFDFDLFTLNFRNKNDANLVVDEITPKAGISPFAPIFVDIKSENQLIQNALQGLNEQDKTFIVPAIFLKYYDQKNFNDAIEKSVTIAFDVATIVGSGGTLLATKVHWAKRIFSAISLAGAVGNIGVNVGLLPSTGLIGNAVKYYNLAMLLVGGVHLGNGIYNASKYIANNKINYSLGLKNTLSKYSKEIEEAYPELKALKGAETKTEASKLIGFNEVLKKVLGQTNLLVKISKLENKFSSQNFIWKNIDETNVVWINPNSNLLSTAKSFSKEIGNTLYDFLLEDGFYVKFDLYDGRILLGNTNGTYHAFGVLDDASLRNFKSSNFNSSDEVFNSKLSKFITLYSEKLKVISGVVSKEISMLGSQIKLSNDKVNTIIGRHDPDIRELFDEIGDFKNVGLGEVKGGINTLNKPLHYNSLSSKEWWERWNKVWLERAINRGDDIYLATLITKRTQLINEFNEPINILCFEIKYLTQKGIKPKNITNDLWEEYKSWFK